MDRDKMSFLEKTKKQDVTHRPTFQDWILKMKMGTENQKSIG